MLAETLEVVAPITGLRFFPDRSIKSASGSREDRPKTQGASSALSRGSETWLGPLIVGLLSQAFGLWVRFDGCRVLELFALLVICRRRMTGGVMSRLRDYKNAAVALKNTAGITSFEVLDIAQLRKGHH
jgi:hypothetical protein